MKEFLPFNKMKILSYYQDAIKLSKGEIMMPRMLSVWLSQVCNLRCSYCLYSDYNKEVSKFIDTRKFIEFINEIASLGIESVEFSGGGEPMLHPDFYQIAEFIKFKGLKVGVLTNGTVITDIDRLVKTFSYIRISLDAIDEEKYNQLKSPIAKDVYENVKTNIKELLKARGDNDKPRIGVKFLVSKSNIEDIPRAVQIAKDLKVDYIQFKKMHSSEGEMGKEEEEAQRVINIFKETDKVAVTGNVRKQVLKERCFIAPIHAVIDSNGNIYVCCFFNDQNDLKIGNIFESRFLDVWGSEKHKRIMKSLDMSNCNKRDCRWIFYNNFMKEVIDDDIMDISFN